MIEWYKKVVFENFGNFNGRARRSEYWFFGLTQVLILFTLVILGAIVGSLFDNAFVGLFVGYMVFAFYSMITVVPTLAVTVRRLHDVGKSGWFYFIALIPFVGSIWLLILFCTEGAHGPNEYGADPKNEIEEINEIGKIELQ